MRNPGIWLAIAAAVGPLILGGALFVPVSVLLVGVQQQVAHKDGGVAPGFWIALVAAAVLGLLIYPAHFDTVAKCDEIARGEPDNFSEMLVGETAESTRVEMIQAGCSNLPFYTMPSF